MISIKMHSSDSGLVTGHQMYCLEECMCAHFSLEILQAVAVKGLILLSVRIFSRHKREAV